jgi:hypothetical protein
MVEAQGYVVFFLTAAALGLPAVILTPFATRARPDRAMEDVGAES